MTTWLYLEGIMLNKISQRRQLLFHHLYVESKQHIHRHRWKMVGCQKQREGVGGEGKESMGINLQSKISPAHVIYSIVTVVINSISYM